MAKHKVVKRIATGDGQHKVVELTGVGMDVDVKDGGIYQHYIVNGEDQGESPIDIRCFSDFNYDHQLPFNLDEWERHALEAVCTGPERAARQAAVVLKWIAVTRAMLSLGASAELLYNAIDLGRAWEKLAVLQFEPDVAKGMRASRRADVASQKNAADCASRHEEIRTRCQAMLDQDPRLLSKKTTVVGQLVKAFKGRERGFGRTAITDAIRPLFEAARG